jgi:BolA protein
VGPVAAELERRIRAATTPEYLDIIDETALHHGHSGHNPEGESHFRVVVRASGLDALPRVERTRAVLKAAGDLVTGGRIHALSVEVRPGG